MKIKKALATVMAGAMLFTASLPVFAAEPTITLEVIDTTKKGSITLVKTLEPTGAWLEANGLDNDGIPSALPIGGIVFNEYKIADIETYNNGGKIGTYYTNLSADFLALAKELGVTIKADATANKKNYYKATTLEAALETMNHSQTKVEELIVKDGVSFTATNAAGKTSKTDLDLGLYLIGEIDTKNATVDDGFLTGDDTYIHLSGLTSMNTDPSAVLPDGDDGDVFAAGVNKKKISISEKAQPYLISVPTTNTAKIGDHEPGTVWQYDITSFPKNASTSITKVIVDKDDKKTLRTHEDYQIGDTVNYIIFSNSSPLHNKRHEKYQIHDKMTEGLTYSSLVYVKYGPRTKNPKTTDDFSSFTALPSDYYKFEKISAQEFNITFTEAGLAFLDKLGEDTLFVVSFNAKVNKNAKIGTERQNMNQPDLIFDNEFEDEYKITGNKVYVFTYSIQLQKDGLTDPTQAKFKIYTVKNGQPTTTEVAVVKESEGVYHLFDSVYDKAADKVTVVSPAKNKLLLVKGVDSISYALREVETEGKKNLLKEGFKIILTAPAKGTASLDDVDPSANNTTHRDGTVTAKAETSSATANLTTKDGVVYITVVNNDTVQLHTGGNGITWYYIVAIVVGLIACGGCVVMVAKKKRA